MLLFLVAVSLFLYGFLFVPPFIPIYHHIDGLIYVNDGKQMYEGEVMYRDFFQFSPPGTTLVFWLLFKLLGVRPWIPDLTLLVLGIALAWLGVVIARELMHPGLALLPSSIFLAGLYNKMLDPTHHWFSLLCVMMALAVVLERRTRARIAAAGFFCGLAACFTQTRGLAAILGLGVFLWWESRQRQQQRCDLLKLQACLVSGFVASLIAVNGYFAWKAGLARFLWCTLVFGIRYYPKAEENTFLGAVEGFPQFLSLHYFLFALARWLFLYGAIPLAYLLFFSCYRRKLGERPPDFWVRPMLLALVGSFMLLGVAPSPNSIRLASSALPGIILMGWFIDSPGKWARALAAGLVAGALLVAPHAVLNAESSQKWITPIRPGTLAVTSRESLEYYNWVLQHTHASDYLFQAPGPDMYFYLDLRNPTPMPFLTNCGYTTPEQVENVVRSLQQHPVRYVLWSPSALDVIPAWEDPSDDHLGPLRDYLRHHYRVVKVFRNSDEMWEKKE
jgi:hypothetical protein